MVSVMTAATQHMSWSSALSLPHPYHKSIVHLLYNISSHYIHSVSFFFPPWPGPPSTAGVSGLFPEAGLLLHPLCCLVGRGGCGAGRASPGTWPAPLLFCRCSVFLWLPPVLCCFLLLPVFIGKAKAGLYYLKSVSSLVLLLLYKVGPLSSVLFVNLFIYLKVLAFNILFNVLKCWCR